MGFLHDDVLDAALDEIQTNVTTLTICNALPTTFAQANDDPGSAGYKLGTKSSPTVGSPQDGDTSGRKITISAISDGSVGYTVIEKRKKLKAEFSDLTGPEIVKLKKKGVKIDYPLDIPIVTYLGDTRYVDFSSLEYVVNSRILIAECTFFVDEHLSRADAGKHMHIT